MQVLERSVIVTELAVTEGARAGEHVARQAANAQLAFALPTGINLWSQCSSTPVTELLAHIPLPGCNPSGHPTSEEWQVCVIGVSSVSSSPLTYHSPCVVRGGWARTLRGHACVWRTENRASPEVKTVLMALQVMLGRITCFHVLVRG